MIHRISAYKSKKLGFEIPDLKIFNGSYGTLSEPHLFKVVYGQNFQKSLRKGSDFQKMLEILNKSLNHSISQHIFRYQFFKQDFKQESTSKARNYFKAF